MVFFQHHYIPQPTTTHEELPRQGGVGGIKIKRMTYWTASNPPHKKLRGIKNDISNTDGSSRSKGVCNQAADCCCIQFEGSWPDHLLKICPCIESTSVKEGNITPIITWQFIVGTNNGRNCMWGVWQGNGHLIEVPQSSENEFGHKTYEAKSMALTPSTLVTNTRYQVIRFKKWHVQSLLSN